MKEHKNSLAVYKKEVINDKENMLNLKRKKFQIERKITGIFLLCAAAEVILETAQLRVAKNIAKIPKSTVHLDFIGRTSPLRCAFVKSLVLLIV